MCWSDVWLEGNRNKYIVCVMLYASESNENKVFVSACDKRVHVLISFATRDS